jgi:hypothetical protein
MKRQTIKSFAILIAVALLAPAFVALVYAQGVSLVTYPRYVTNAVPANDEGSDGGPAYRQSNPSESNAPFAVILRVVGYSGTVGYFWLSDNQAGNTVQTYDRFDSGATKNLNPSGCSQGSCWLDESTTLPSDLNGITITANSFYLMVIGRITGTVSSGTINYTLHYKIGDATGALNFASTVTATPDCVDWYLNWNDDGTPPGESGGDPASGADYVELYDSAGNSFTTAPVDGNGYFEMLLPNQTSGNWLAEARSESGSIMRAWYTTIANTSTCSETIYSGTGGPTRVTLKGLEASAGQRPVLAVAAIVLLALGIGFAFRSGRKSS